MCAAARRPERLLCHSSSLSDRLRAFVGVRSAGVLARVLRGGLVRPVVDAPNKAAAEGGDARQRLLALLHRHERRQAVRGAVLLL